MESQSRVFDLYGVGAKDIEEARVIIEAALEATLEPHESAYCGGNYYLLPKYQGGRVTLQPNYIEFTKTWAEETYRDHHLLLYISYPRDPDALRRTLERVSGGRVLLLRRDRVMGGKRVSEVMIEGK
jgi:hypothetical protein